MVRESAWYIDTATTGKWRLGNRPARRRTCVLQVLLHFLCNFTLDISGSPSTSGPLTFLVHVYAIADKYDIGPLRALAVERLDKECHPMKNGDNFIAVVRVTEACAAENTIWDVLMPKAKASVGFLLKQDSFRELVVEIPALSLSLLDLLGGTK
jgi:hypothetical protein